MGGDGCGSREVVLTGSFREEGGKEKTQFGGGGPMLAMQATEEQFDGSCSYLKS